MGSAKARKGGRVVEGSGLENRRSTTLPLFDFPENPSKSSGCALALSAPSAKRPRVTAGRYGTQVGTVCSPSSPSAWDGVNRRKLPRSLGLPLTDRDFADLRAALPEGATVLSFAAAALRRETRLHQTLTFRQAAEIFRRSGKDSRYLPHMVRHWGDTHLGLIDEAAVTAAAFELYPTQSNATRNRVVISTTQSVINHALRIGGKHKERLSVPRLREIRREKTPVDKAWVQAFIAEASPRLRALCLLMYSTGARVTEALSVTWGDLDLAAGLVLVKQTKVARENWRELTPACKEALQALYRGQAPGERVIGYASRHSAKRPWSTTVRRAGIKDLGFHACRHGFATDLLHAGVDPVTIAHLGGWSNPARIWSTYGHARRARGITAVLTEGGANV